MVLAKVEAFFYDVFSLSFLSPTVNDIRRKLYMVGTYSTVEKRAKRMPDATVKTTKILTQILNYL